jgi:putative oxidoreductase
LKNISDVLNLAARLLIAQLFLIGGIGKLGAEYESTLQYMEAFGVPGALLVPAIIFEIGVACLLIVGWQIRVVAISAALFCIVAGLLFHFDWSDFIQQILFLKNLAIAGGSLALVAHGAGSLSIDGRLGRR